MNKNRIAMGITGVFGFLFFLIANFTIFFEGASVAAGLVQLAINFAVFLAWGRNFLQTTGREKLFSLGGVLIPLGRLDKKDFQTVVEAVKLNLPLSRE